MAPHGARCAKCELAFDGQQDDDKILRCSSATCSVHLHYSCSVYTPVELEFLEKNNVNVKWFCDCCANKSITHAETQPIDPKKTKRFVFELRNNGSVTELFQNLNEEEQTYVGNILDKSLRGHQDVAVQTAHKHGAKVFREAETEEDETPETEAAVSLENDINLQCLNAVLANSEPLKVNVEQGNRFYDTPIDNNVRYYTTRSKRRGNVLIINNYEFKEESYRNGAIVDQRNLEELFTQMGMNVVTYENCTAQVMRDVIEDFTKYAPEKECDMCFAFIMSHGREDNNETYISGIDDLEVTSSWIESRFNNYNCSLYHRKPKVLIYQVCRGPVLDIIPQHKYTEPCPSHTDCYSDELNRSYEDMLVGHSTMYGYKAHRDPDRGTWYIELICMAFMEHAHDTHVEELLKKVDVGLRKRISEETRSVQTSTFTNHGFHNCYIHPGIYEEDGLVKRFVPIV